MGPRPETVARALLQLVAPLVERARARLEDPEDDPEKSDAARDFLRMVARVENVAARSTLRIVDPLGPIEDLRAAARIDRERLAAAAERVAAGEDDALAEAVAFAERLAERAQPCPPARMAYAPQAQGSVAPLSEAASCSGRVLGLGVRDATRLTQGAATAAQAPAEAQADAQAQDDGLDEVWPEFPDDDTETGPDGSGETPAPERDTLHENLSERVAR